LLGAFAGAILPTLAMPEAELRVCADPDNLPFSDEKGEGFENKVVDLIAAEFGMQVSYIWHRGHVTTLPASGDCDILMGYTQGPGRIENTNPYYRTSYVLLFREGDQSLAGIQSLGDPRLKQKAIGTIARTPPETIIAMNGLLSNARFFEADTGNGSPKAAVQVVDAIAAGKIDAGVLWGPLGGYYAQGSKVPLTIVPLAKEKVGPSTVYGITMGVRPNEPEWKHKLNKLIAENQADINAVLAEYNVPLLDENGNLISPPKAER
jgi:quinoprotein dehydrogenase-associated probable ABC transporter substrate-binding protein